MCTCCTQTLIACFPSSDLKASEKFQALQSVDESSLSGFRPTWIQVYRQTQHIQLLVEINSIFGRALTPGSWTGTFHFRSVNCGVTPRSSWQLEFYRFQHHGDGFLSAHNNRRIPYMTRWFSGGYVFVNILLEDAYFFQSCEPRPLPDGSGITPDHGFTGAMVESSASSVVVVIDVDATARTGVVLWGLGIICNHQLISPASDFVVSPVLLTTLVDRAQNGSSGAGPST